MRDHFPGYGRKRLFCFVCCLCSADGMFANASMSSVMSAKSRPGNQSGKQIKKKPGKSGSKRSKATNTLGYERYRRFFSRRAPEVNSAPPPTLFGSSDICLSIAFF